MSMNVWYGYVCDKIETGGIPIEGNISRIIHPKSNRHVYLPMIEVMYPFGFKVYGIFSGSFDKVNKQTEDLRERVENGEYSEFMPFQIVKKELKLTLTEIISRWLFE